MILIRLLKNTKNILKHKNMKKISFIISIFLLTLTITECASPQKRMGNKLNQTYIGMDLSEFNKIFVDKELIKMENNTTIYLVNEKAYYGGESTYRYFYFSNNKLTQVDQGVRAIERKQIDINLNKI